MAQVFKKDIQYVKFCSYGFLKNLRFFDAFIILFFLDKGLSYLQIGILYSIKEITINILEIPTGVIADSFGRRRSMIFAFINYITSFIIFFLFSHYYLFIVAFLFYGIGDAFRTGTHKAMIFEYLKIKGWENQKVYYYGHTRSWSQAGSALSSLLAAFFVFFYKNYSVIFLFSIIPYIIDLFLMISYPKELDGELQKFKLKEVKNIFLNVIQKFIYSIKNINVLKAITNISIYSGYYKAVKDYIQPFLKSFAISIPILISMEVEERSAIVVGFIYFIIHFINFITPRLSGLFAEKTKSLYLPLNLTLIIGFSIGILIGLVYNFNLISVSVLLFILIFVIENLRKPIGVSYVADLFDKNILATALSAESQANTIFAAIIAPLLGFLTDKLGLGNSFIITSSMVLITLPLYLAKKNK